MNLFMTKRGLLRLGVLGLFLLVFFLLIFRYHPFADADRLLTIQAVTDYSGDDSMEIFYIKEGQLTEKQEELTFTAEQSACVTISSENQTAVFSIPCDTAFLRIDPGSTASKVTISSLQLSVGPSVLTPSDEMLNSPVWTSGVGSFKGTDGLLEVECENGDPQLVYDIRSWGQDTFFDAYLAKKGMTEKLPVLILWAFCALLVFWKFDAFLLFPKMIVSNRKLVLQLALNDFKTGFAGSYLGIIWAFVQPVVTILVYWFVFQVGLRSGSPSRVPFVLWLIAGLVPWFFFAEGLNGGTNVLLQYQYLVKKVVFQIEILPFVKLLSALFVHLFFIVFTLVLYTAYGYRPDIYSVQVLYYTFSMFVLVLALCYVTSAIVGFFRDLSQIIGILLQIGVWMTPIMWDFESLNLPGVLRLFFRMNPMFYIVSGYRDALIEKVWFWERTGLSVYFWGITILVFGFGTWLFKRLRVHFADVL